MPDPTQAYAPTLGGNKRARRRKQARIYDGAPPRMRERSKRLHNLPPSYDPRRQTHPDYVVKVEHNKTVRLVYREPKRRIPECERPSKVVRIRPS